MTLTDLQQHVAEDCGISPDAGVTQWGDAQEASKRRTTDMQVAIGVRWVAANKPDLTEESPPAEFTRYCKTNMRRIRREQRRQRRLDRNADPTKCRFVFLALILEGIFSWLIGEACSALWNWLRKAPPESIAAMGMEPACCAMAGVAEEPGTEEYIGDDDDDERD